MRILNRAKKRTKPTSSADFEVLIKELEVKLAEGARRQQDIEAVRGSVYLHGSDKELAELQADAASLSEELHTVEAALDAATHEHSEALRREQVEEVESRMAEAKKLHVEQHADYVKISDRSETLANLLQACKDRQETITAANHFAVNSGCGDLRVPNMLATLSGLIGRPVPSPEQTIVIPQYWPAHTREQSPAWAEFKDFDPNAEHQTKIAKRAEERKAAKDELHRKRRDTERAQQIAARQEQQAKKAEARRQATMTARRGPQG